MIDRPRPLAHEARAHPMQSQQIHLLRCFDRHETHGRSQHGFRNRFSIAVVVLVPLEERFDVLRRDQTHVVAQSGQLAADVMEDPPVTTKEKIVVGDRMPADVELEAVPADWGPSLTKYRYVTCIRVTPSYWSIQVAVPSFSKSTDAFARSGAL